MSFIPEIEQQNIEKQELFQLGKLKQLLSYLVQNSPYYQRKFKELNTDIHNISSLRELHLLPTTSKQDLQACNMDFLCVPNVLIREYTATSGTTGAPVIIALTEQDIQRLAYNEFLSFNCMGVTEQDIFQLMLTLDRQFMAGMAYHYGLRKIGASSVRTGPGLPAMQWDIIRQLRSTGMVAVPSFLLKMIDYAEQMSINLQQTSVTKVLAIGEALRNDLLLPNALAEKITARWNIQLYNTYASTEMQTAFTECAEGRGGHQHPELIITELLDDQGYPVAAGEPGEVTITTLGVEGMPLLRYRTGDICRAYYEPCRCSRKTMRLGPVLGRKQQMIKLKGTTLFPTAIFELLHKTGIITEYFVELFTNNEEQDDIHLYLCTSETPEICNQILKPMLKHKLRVVPDIQYITAKEMQQMQFPPESRKQIRFKDLRSGIILSS